MSGADDQLEARLQRQLLEVFALPSSQERSDYQSSDLGLDIVLSSYRRGEFQVGTLFDIDLPLVWRPKIEFRARLYNLDTGEEKATFKIVEKITRREYVARALRRYISFRWRVFDDQDLEALLNRGSERLLKRLIAAI